MPQSLNEQRLMEVLSGLERRGGLAKGGDALQNAPHDGGFATEGTNIQAKAKAKKAMRKAIKAMVAKGIDPAEAEKLVKAIRGEEDEDEDSSSPVAKGGDDESSDEDMASEDDGGEGEGGDDESSALPSQAKPPIAKDAVGKSLGAAQLANSTQSHREQESLRKSLSDDDNKMVDATPVLGMIIKSFDGLTNQVREALSGGGKRVKGDRKLRKSFANYEKRQYGFNDNVAKALGIICGQVDELRGVIVKMANEPVHVNRNQLQKGNLHQPDFNASTHEIDGRQYNPMEQSPLIANGISLMAIQNTLADLCMKSGGKEVSLDDVTKFENTQDLNMLPPNVVRQLENRLCPAASA
jgi:hypothetical protein